MKALSQLFLPAIALAVVACGGGQTTNPQDRLTVHDAEINEVIAKMTLEEKVEMLHSKTNMSSEGVPSQGIPDIKYTDGPFGIREEGVPTGFQSAGWTLDSATYFPTGSALAATWSPELAYKYGTGMGREARLRGKDVILGPAINIQRLPVGGRSYEYLSEDPILSADLAAEYVKGVQDAGTAACIKHYALNSQETNRGTVNVIVDERTMREIYLKPFEAAIGEDVPFVMVGHLSLPSVTGGDTPASLSHEVVTGILREELGFGGVVITDSMEMGAATSSVPEGRVAVEARLAGVDVVLMPPSFEAAYQGVLDAVSSGELDAARVDASVRRVLAVKLGRLRA